jgi:hypothetical protein
MSRPHKRPKPISDKSDNHYHAAEKVNSAAEQPPRWPPSWYSPFWPNWAFVIVGGAGGLAALLTLFAMREQASHLAKQVELTDQQLKALIEAQKPKLVLYPHLNPAEDVLDRRGPFFVVDLKNGLPLHLRMVGRNHSPAVRRFHGQCGSLYL